MTIDLSPAAELLLNEQMARGHFGSPSDLVEHALRLYGFHLTEEESLAALRESVAEAEAGKTIPAEQVFEEIRNKHGWAEE